MPNRTSPKADSDLLRTGDVAEMFDVSERTVIRWGKTGKLPCVETPGGRLRFRRADIEAALGIQPVAEASA